MNKTWQPRTAHKTCPDCYKRIEKVGPPVLCESSGFLDQIVQCTNCDWCGVETMFSPSAVELSILLTYQPTLF